MTCQNCAGFRKPQLASKLRQNEGFPSWMQNEVRILGVGTVSHKVGGRLG
jgi:hypothetical protein